MFQETIQESSQSVTRPWEGTCMRVSAQVGGFFVLPLHAEERHICAWAESIFCDKMWHLHEHREDMHVLRWHMMYRKKKKKCGEMYYTHTHTHTHAHTHTTHLSLPTCTWTQDYKGTYMGEDQKGLTVVANQYLCVCNIYIHTHSLSFLHTHAHECRFTKVHTWERTTKVSPWWQNARRIGRVVQCVS